MGSKEIKPGVYQYEPDESLRLHRGLGGGRGGITLNHVLLGTHDSNEDVNDGKGVPGIHWTDEHKVAKEFATGDWGPFSTPNEHGVVLSGDVHPDEVLGPHTPGWRELKDMYDIYDEDHEEREHTLPSNPTIRNLSAVQFDDGKMTKAKYLGDIVHGQYTGTDRDKHIIGRERKPELPPVLNSKPNG